MTLLAGIVQVPVIARTLGPERYGTAALVFAVPSFVFTVVDPRSSEAVIRYVSEFVAANDRKRAAAVVRLGYIVDAASTMAGVLLVAAVSAWAADSVVHDDGTQALIVGFAAALATAAPAATARGLLTTMERFTLVARLQIGVSITRAAVVIGAVLATRSLSGFIVSTALTIVAESLLLVAVARHVQRKELGNAPATASLADRRREIVRFILYSDAIGIAGVIPKQADVLVLGYLTGAREVGLYRLALSLASPIARVGGPLTNVFYPRLARTAAGVGASNIRQEMRWAILYGTLPCLVLAGVAAIGAPVAVALVGGDDYDGASMTARVVLAGTALSLGFFWIRPLFLATGRVRALLALATLTAPVALVGFWIGASDHGHLGVAVARLLVVSVGGSVVGAFYLWYRIARPRAGHPIRP